MCASTYWGTKFVPHLVSLIWNSRLSYVNHWPSEKNDYVACRTFLYIFLCFLLVIISKMLLHVPTILLLASIIK